jgi:tetratricopeptide (TPR) repeat protein
MNVTKHWFFLLLAILSVCHISVVGAAQIKGENGEVLSVSDKLAGLLQAGIKAQGRGDYAGAIDKLTAALELSPSKQVTALLLNQRAAARLYREDAAGALSDANEAIRLKPELASAYSKRGLVYRRSGERTKAIADFDRAIQLNPKLIDAYNNRGLIRSDMGQREAAIRDFSEAIRRNPNYAYAYNNRAVEYDRLGNKAKALADYGEALRRDPNLANSHINRASLLKEMGQSRKAATDYDHLTRSTPRHTLDFISRGDAFNARGDYRKAAADYRRALQLSPSHRDALNALAWLEATCPDASVRNGKAALEKSLKVCELTKWREPDYLDTLAAACAETGDFEKAVKYQTRALETAPQIDREKMKERLALYRQQEPYRASKKS